MSTENGRERGVGKEKDPISRVPGAQEGGIKPNRPDPDAALPAKGGALTPFAKNATGKKIKPPKRREECR